MYFSFSLLVLLSIFSSPSFFTFSQCLLLCFLFFAFCFLVFDFLVFCLFLFLFCCFVSTSSNSFQYFPFFLLAISLIVHFSSLCCRLQTWKTFLSPHFSKNFIIFTAWGQGRSQGKDKG